MSRGHISADVAEVAGTAAVAPSLDSLAGALTDTLPTGSSVVVRWQGADGDGVPAAAGASTRLRAHADASLDGRRPPLSAAEINETWEERGTRIALAARLAEPLPPASRAAWVALARRAVAATLASEHAQARIESLQKSQRLQQALYEIADLAGSGLEMQEMLGRIHAGVARLLNAENF